jgi:hypothetical protein
MRYSKAEVRKAVAAYKKVPLGASKPSTAPENHGVDKRTSETVLAKLHKSRFRIPANLKHR